MAVDLTSLDCPGFYDPDQKVLSTSHGNLPHWSQSHAYTFVTWRLGDALPAEVVAQIAAARARWIAEHPTPWTADVRQDYGRKFAHRADRLLDKGFGSCVLRMSQAASIVSGALRHFDGTRYILDAYVIMPNHVHVLIGMSDVAALATVVHSWKSFTANNLRPYLPTVKAIWQEGYWERIVRSSKHLGSCRAYIQANPERAKLQVGHFDAYARFPDWADERV
ncbi:MAG: transposase [Fimbriimonadaceae bacterium]